MTIHVPENRTGWWGGPDTRPRCAVTGKVAFAEQDKAERSAAKVRAREGNVPRPMQAYACDKCGHWHVGHGTRK